MNVESIPLTELQEIALTLVRNGYHPIPIEYGEKRPGYSGWQNRVQTEESALKDFRRRVNVGLLQGIPASDNTFPVTIDVDVDDGAFVGYVERLIGADCPKKRGKKGMSFLVRGVGNIPPQKLHDYRGGKKKPAGDVLTKGSQTVIPPSIHPETQLPYMWRTGINPLNTKYQELPLIDEWVIDAIKAYLKDADNPIAQLDDMDWKGVGGGGNTHDTCVAAVASMVARGWPDEPIFAKIRRAKREACERAGEAYNWPDEYKACQEWIDSAREKDFGRKKTKARPSHGEIADQVLAQHAQIIRRDKATRDWCIYNGKFWEQHATEELKTIIRECLSDELITKSNIDGVEAVMRTYREIGVRDDLWDEDKHYLNTPDGTFNLKTGEMMPHNPAHHITKMTRVSPRFDYQDSLWVKSIGTWFDDDPVEIAYIQILFGLFLTGETKDECVAMWIGKSGAGKSKMTDAMSYIMGDYAQTATDTAFLDVRYHPHLEEVARMRGKRLIFIHEVEGYLNLRRLKSIASGEGASASFKGKDSFEFRPQAKIWLVGNEAPPTRSSGRELQRRFHVYEFVRQIEANDMDLDLGAKLRDEASFVLGWAIDGARKYYDKGLTRSPHVIESTDRYFVDADIIAQWVEECCVIDKTAVTPVGPLFESFDMWSEGSRIRAMLDKGRFSQRLKAKGFALERKTLVRGKQAVRVVSGLRLKTDDEMPLKGMIGPGDQF